MHVLLQMGPDLLLTVTATVSHTSYCHNVGAVPFFFFFFFFLPSFYPDIYPVIAARISTSIRTYSYSIRSGIAGPIAQCIYSDDLPPPRTLQLPSTLDANGLWNLALDP